MYVHAPAEPERGDVETVTVRPRMKKPFSSRLMGLAGLAVGMGLGLSIWLLPAPASRTGSADSSSADAISSAVQSCQLTSSTGITVMDGGYSIELQTSGKQKLGAPYSDVTCVLDALVAPESVKTRMDTTRALDGSQDATWAGYAATWTYHPDNGLNIIVETKATP